MLYEVITTLMNLPQILTDYGYLGFTAGTGAGFQRHLVRGIHVSFP